MDKRYQVFVSSTYADLKEEREHVIQALMEMDCIPAGMELFPAADEEQWEFIKKVIDDCDYYLLIIGGRYGSVSPDGISYTEKEFDYAVESGLKVIALIHGEPDNIPFGKTESDPALRNKLLEFRDKVMDGRLVKFWKTYSDLPGLVALSLTKTIKMYPAIGWVRADQVANEDLLIELNQLRKENGKLSNQLAAAMPKSHIEIDNLADIESNFVIHGTYEMNSPYGGSEKKMWETEISWKEIFSLIAPYILEQPLDLYVKRYLINSLKDRLNLKGFSHLINDQEFKTITIQLKAYGLVDTNYTKTTKGGMGLFWTLTPKGEKYMVESRVIRSDA